MVFVMPVILSSSSTIPSYDVNQFKLNGVLDPKHTFLSFNVPRKLRLTSRTTVLAYKSKLPRSLKCMHVKCTNFNTNFFDEDTGDADVWVDEEEFEDLDSPWEGAVVYERNASITHLEYSTTLERLGLEKISSEVSRSRASLMGLRVIKPVNDFPLGTPVLISIDVTRKKGRLRLDGIIRTVIALSCNSCGGPAAQSVYSNISLLLTEDPVEEPEDGDLGVIYGDKKFTSSEEEDDDDDSIDFEDRLHFPPEQKLIDISKHIRDIIHLEIVITAVCDPKCKGFCFKCGTNLNTGRCDCAEEKIKEKTNRSFGGLREQMQQN